MKTASDRAGNRRVGRDGQTFIVVMMLTGILMIAGASLTYLTSNASFTSRKINNGARALAIAEAGVAERVSHMTTNYMAWANASNNAPYGGGRYYVKGTLNTNMNCLIRSTGILGADVRVVALELLGTLYMAWDQTVNVDGAIVSDGNVHVDNPANIYGDVRGNGNATGSGTVYGWVEVAGADASLGTSPADQQTNNQPSVPVPDYREEVDLWRARAQTDPAYYFTNDMSWGMGDDALTPTSGVIFVEGNVTLSRKVTIVGTVYATGNITVTQQFNNWTAFNTNWPCAIAGLTFDCQNQNQYPGTIFGGLAVNISNRRTIHGCIISMGTVSIGGNTDVFAAGAPPAWDPGDTNKASPPVISGPWLL